MLAEFITPSGFISDSAPHVLLGFPVALRVSLSILSAQCLLAPNVLSWSLGAAEGRGLKERTLPTAHLPDTLSLGGPACRHLCITQFQREVLRKGISSADL